MPGTDCTATTAISATATTTGRSDGRVVARGHGLTRSHTSMRALALRDLARRGARPRRARGVRRHGGAPRHG
eukprot:4750063-Prymnesium_polylepis.1